MPSSVDIGAAEVTCCFLRYSFDETMAAVDSEGDR